MTSEDHTPPTADVREAVRNLIEPAVWAWFNAHDAPWSPSDRTMLELSGPLADAIVREVRPRGTVTDAEVEAAAESFAASLLVPEREARLAQSAFTAGVEWRERVDDRAAALSSPPADDVREAMCRHFRFDLRALRDVGPQVDEFLSTYEVRPRGSVTSPADDVREALALAIDPNALEVDAYPWPLNAADRVLERFEVRLRGTVTDAEPTDAQVLAGLNAELPSSSAAPSLDYYGPSNIARMRNILRCVAGGGVSTDDGNDRLIDEYHDRAVRAEGAVPEALAALANRRGTDAGAEVLAIEPGRAAVTGSSVQDPEHRHRGR